MLRGKNKKLDNLTDKRTSLPLKTPSIVEHTAKIVTLSPLRNKNLPTSNRKSHKRKGNQLQRKLQPYKQPYSTSLPELE